MQKVVAMKGAGDSINADEQMLREQLSRQDGTFMVIPVDGQRRVRIIALKYSGGNGGPEGHEASLNAGMVHVEQVLADSGFEIMWPPFALANASSKSTREIWLRYRRAYLKNTGPGYAG